jgi:hypothetical protein
MAGAKLKDHAKWLAQGWSWRNGSEWPQCKKATIKRHLDGWREASILA